MIDIHVVLLEESVAFDFEGLEDLKEYVTSHQI
jgi:hypothetical protein